MNKKKSFVMNGFTLIEVIIAMAISAVMFMAIGSLMLNMQKSIFKSQRDMEFLSTDRTGKLMLQKEIRRGKDVFINPLASATNKIDIYALDGTTKTIKLNGETVLVEDQATAAEYFVMDNVQSIQFRRAGYNNSGVEVEYEREKLLDQVTGAVVKSSTTFTVKLRNLQN